jgi:uncharacterized membrane protein YkoI
MGVITSLVALVVAGLLVVGGLGGAAVTPMARTSVPHVSQVQLAVVKETVTAQSTDVKELTDTADTDDVEVQEGDQSGPDNGADVEEASDGQDAAVTGTPAISADAARQAAETYLNAGSATKVELDDENGKLVYSVEIGSTDVKVDATTGSVITAESGED